MAKGLDFEEEARRTSAIRHGTQSVDLEDRTLSPRGFGRVKGSQGERCARELEVTPVVMKQEPLDKALSAILEGEATKAAAKIRLEAKRKARRGVVATSLAGDRQGRLEAAAQASAKRRAKQASRERVEATLNAAARDLLTEVQIAVQHLPGGARRHVLVETAKIGGRDPRK